LDLNHQGTKVFLRGRVRGGSFTRRLEDAKERQVQGSRGWRRGLDQRVGEEWGSGVVLWELGAEGAASCRFATRPPGGRATRGGERFWG
jgi:hypothetical protein